MVVGVVGGGDGAGYGGVWARCGGNGRGECGEAIRLFGWKTNLRVDGEEDWRLAGEWCSDGLVAFAGVGAPDAQGDGGAADGVSAARWLRRNGRPVALARRPWVHRLSMRYEAPGGYGLAAYWALGGGSGLRRRGCRRRRSAACR